MKTTVKERLIKYLKYKGVTQKEFEISIGASNGYVNNIVKGIGNDKLQSISEKYSDLNRNWLLFEEGDMLNTTEKAEEKEEQSFSQDNTQQPIHVHNKSAALLIKAMEMMTSAINTQKETHESNKQMILLITKLVGDATQNISELISTTTRNITHLVDDASQSNEKIIQLFQIICDSQQKFFSLQEEHAKESANNLIIIQNVILSELKTTQDTIIDKCRTLTANDFIKINEPKEAITNIE